MAEKHPSNVDRWLERETPRVRKALESASRYFDSNDTLTVNTLEAVYGQESSFGTMMGQRGSSAAARYLKDLDTFFSKNTELFKAWVQIPAPR